MSDIKLGNAEVRTQSWAGVSSIKVEVIGETPKKYRVVIVDETSRWPGRRRFVKQGDIRLVPKQHVTFLKDPQ